MDMLDKTLLPFIAEVYPFGHRFMQDNDPKHSSLHAWKFMEEKGVKLVENSSRIPGCQSNLESILWHELKEFIRRDVKPTTKNELVEGIQKFWRTVTVNKCAKYIRHLRKVIPRIIELNGEATGY